jgi:accessory gene regulator B
LKFIRKWSYGCANALTAQLAENHQKKAIYYYGFQIVIGGIVKGIALVLAALVLGILRETVITILFFASLRTIAGGYHMSTYGKCMVTSMAMLLAGGFIVKYAHQYFSAEVFIILSIIIYTAGFISIMKWAPADTPNKRITDPKKRKSLKMWSLVHINLWLAASIILSCYKINELVIAGCFGIILAIFIITPAGYSFFGFIEGKRKNTTFTNLS